ncbi:MAG: ankyrin repeat domain-containing protein [Gemmatimonadota bacterium]
MTTTSARWAGLALCTLTLITVTPVPSAAQAGSAQEQLWDAAKIGDTTAISVALGRGARIDSLDTRTNINGRRALNWAVWFDQAETIRFLAKRGADINLANVTGFTPLHHAAENGSLAAARALVALGADRKLRTAEELRAADVARLREKLLVAALLDSLPDK